jgi:hypothetical protein
LITNLNGLANKGQNRAGSRIPVKGTWTYLLGGDRDLTVLEVQKGVISGPETASTKPNSDESIFYVSIKRRVFQVTPDRPKRVKNRSFVVITYYLTWSQQQRTESCWITYPCQGYLDVLARRRSELDSSEGSKTGHFWSRNGKYETESC